VGAVFRSEVRDDGMAAMTPVSPPHSTLLARRTDGPEGRRTGAGAAGPARRGGKEEVRLRDAAYHVILAAAAVLAATLAGLGWGVPGGLSTPDTRPEAARGVGRWSAAATSARAQAAGLPTGPRRDDEPAFHAIGSDACRTCHRAIWQAWERTGHATAAERLNFDERLSPDCQPCHLPYEEVEAGVGCEACHGPGSAYAALAVMIDPFKRQRAGLEDAGAGCVDCHNPGHPFHRERDLGAAAGDVHPVPPGR